MHPTQYLRRKQAGEYLKTRYGFGSEKSLAKLATVGGGPAFHKAGVACLYEPAALDDWARSKIGPAHRSTSEFPYPKTGRPARSAAE
ncbi:MULTISPECIES: hypothetical protein [Methylosinus]|uniref:DNA-binding protein n=1 Tax=Methylosinus trichosporium (strain ATCC 35070 / NCIMB 11131 / UNIQEM 75 / OB3b) TaxID=595536 RepID=A0A2D2CX66_METT3|nr:MULTISPECIES: hypothetical protein [Methylosinus]ATQ67350.1 hypothetical protein CQW49_05170 [Methylosinus trichosporium OB3b]OBS51636.1 hypothetical protein A8B73_15610 [Methylosinus sp. 3S-1]